MNLQSKFGYCIITKILNIALCKRDGITDRQTDEGLMEDPISRCPWWTFQAWALKGVLVKQRCPRLQLNQNMAKSVSPTF